tara:strand:+ start:544 stop:1347 length:804 start_codon:yes stop_codon:yes gene_type:complete
MSTAFVSTMNKKLYDQYGKRFIDEFASFASESLKLFVVFEGEYPTEILNMNKNIIVVPFLSEKHRLFLKYFGKLYEANGLRLRQITENGQKKLNISNDYHFNSIKFSFKPFSIHQVLNYIPQDLDFLIWTDADLRCKKKFDQNSLSKYLPNEEFLMTYLGRKKPWYSECGFLAFNLNHKDFEDYIERVIDIYTSGEIFSLEQWHDSWIWDHVRCEFEDTKNVNFKNISGKGYDLEHPFVNCGLEEFFDHLKGPTRKDQGKSFTDDYK